MHLFFEIFALKQSQLSDSKLYLKEIEDSYLVYLEDECLQSSR